MSQNVHVNITEAEATEALADMAKNAQRAMSTSEAVAAAAADPEGRSLVQAILDRKVEGRRHHP